VKPAPWSGEAPTVPPSDEQQHASARPPRTLAAIMAYNNGANVERVLARIPPKDERDYDVLVVDDGSTDDTAAYIAKFPEIPVVRHPQNRGVGAALKSGVRYALDHGYDIICVMAGNDKDDPREIERVVAPVREGRADYVQGSRFAPGGAHDNTPGFRFVMVQVHATMFRVLTGFKGTDALNGFRAYRTSLFTDGTIDIWQDWLDKYEYETYLHFQVLRQHKRVVEVGVSKTYPPKKGRGKYSHIRPLVDWWKILRPIPMVMLGIKK
jgi:dolichol-phosphate mannosyltransferase